MYCSEEKEYPLVKHRNNVYYINIRIIPKIILSNAEISLILSLAHGRLAHKIVRSKLEYSKTTKEIRDKRTKMLLDNDNPVG